MKNFLIYAVFGFVAFIVPANAYDLPKVCYEQDAVIEKQKQPGMLILKVSKEDTAGVIKALMDKFPDWEPWSAESAAVFVTPTITSIVYFDKGCATIQTNLRTPTWMEIYKETIGKKAGRPA